MSRKLALVQWSKTLAVLLIIAGLQILLLDVALFIAYSLITTATTYINTVGALTALRKEAIRDSEKGKEVDLLSMMNQAYDCLPEEFKKLFCRDMLTKGDFLAESVRTIQGYFEKAVEVQKDDSGGDVNEKVDEKMKK